MIMELFCPSWRTLAGCVAEAFWAGGNALQLFILKCYMSFHFTGKYLDDIGDISVLYTL